MKEIKDEIVLRGLRENNLKDIDLNLPKEQITVFTGLSGSGKSSVVFDTLATESRRQMTLNYPLYVRNQMPRYERPRADLMQHLSPVIVVEQKPVGGNTRSTVGTYMDIHPLIRLLFSRIGTPAIGSATDFSSQSSFGKCPECNGFGEVVYPDLHKIIDLDKSLREYAVKFKPLSPSGWQGRWMMTGGLFDPDLPIKEYPPDQYNLLIYGPPEGERVFAPFHTKDGPHDHEWDGLLPRFVRLYINRDISKLKQTSQEDVLAVSTHTLCPTCDGSGLNPEVLKSKINGFNIAEYDHLELTELLPELKNIRDPLGESIAQQAIPNVEQLIDLGLGYLSLSRKMGTLSGGEAQRVKIARHLGSSLNNITYIFDEPSAGLHPEEVDMLIQMLQSLKANHNTVIVIEHDLSVIKVADEIVEMGPGAGAAGGEIVYQGEPNGLQNASALTKLDHKLEINQNPRESNGHFSVTRANNNNLKDVSIDIPKNVLVSVCGVSGSGKSSLLFEAFSAKYPDIIKVNQGRIGISSRSTLATYMGIMDDIRQILAKETGQPAGLFSFNSLGACPVCDGKGVTTPDVAFADPVTVVCEACGGLRYSDEALSYVYRGKNIAEILELTVDESQEYFVSPKILKRMDMLDEVGLNYLTLGQTTSSFSGGEIQRLKLASHLQNEGQIYLLDEPSLGLHMSDNDKLLELFQKLVNKGNSVIIIEHNLDFIAASDWVIELGPGGGKRGGTILFEGTPQEMLSADTLTAKWLKDGV
ncbi:MULTISPECIES: ATP-binding cassette domain-containing protein [unclassified Sporosarcina]|uniref:ATP-binding cassette domain-containing protein n=1 Tax=unclassified Sporosarcina TaxID=2647733 RepID=UPI000C16B5F4|nr:MULTISPECIES: ATP-binding cassette domain-containing protein [unclassified Sporosarcina]PID05259.1 daunorubicin resistance protein DrrC [Sporosarcina sp. P30]PID08533.1 daunorubicin resistance protein DrrC [Sporosarcina sp. P31]PID11474.1 daunorubicin resistance protein DrrC [Sporosarcina sp. P32b]